MGKQDDRCEQAQCPTAERRYKRFFKGLGIIVSPDLRGSTQEKGRCCGIGLYLCVVLPAELSGGPGAMDSVPPDYAATLESVATAPRAPAELSGGPGAMDSVPPDYAATLESG